MRIYGFFSAAVLLCTAYAAADPADVSPAGPGTGKVTVEKIAVHSPSLEGNLEGDSADRSVIVYLPPSYLKDRQRRYPVVYVLHGYTLTGDGMAGLLQSPRTIEAAFAAGAPEMIVVLPDAMTLHSGSMYSTSATIGDWEGFITRDLVVAIDRRYRTIATRESRGLAGHSMGGYGAARLMLKYPEVYAGVYIMSPCCLSAREAPPPAMALALEKTVAAMKTPDEAAKLEGFLPRATLAVAAAWSPNPAKSPLYLDLPTENGVVLPEVLARWAANAPLAMADQYVFNLRRYRAIAMDVGDQDGLKVDAEKLHAIMDSYAIANSFEIYQGDHGNRVADRFEHHVLPFFGRTLSFGQ